MADEALASFQSLLENVPRWISDLENILTTATQQQSAIVATAQPETTTVTPPVRTSVQSSLKSRRSQVVEIVKQTVADEPTLLKEQIPHLTGSDFLRLEQRKRKTASVCSRAESVPNKYRSRGMVAIYYDGDAQKGFETLVRAIGTIRNSIRKGKLSLKIDNLARTGSSSSSSSSFGEETIKGLGTFTYRTTTTLRRPSFGKGDKDDTMAFDKVNDALEKAQLFCERAAHQILRDGDCALEINKAVEHFEQAKEMATVELPTLSKKADKALQRKALEDEKYGLEDERRPSQHSVGSADAYSLPSDGVLEVDSDEMVDDESDSDDFDISAMRLPPHLSKFTIPRPQARATSIVN